MKKLILLLALLIGVKGLAQNDTTVVADATMPDTSTASWSQVDSIKIEMLDMIRQHTASVYRLYATENMWTFLELDTTTGKIWQVQFSIKGPEYRHKTVVNDIPLINIFNDYDEGAYAGRYELYPTQNMYNFLLLDTSDGRTWQVQWSTEKKNRGIIFIPE